MTEQNDKTEAPHYDAEDVRGAEIILKTRRQRVLFGGTLVAVILLGLLLGLVA